MIVTCECNNCLIKDLCVNRNQRLKDIDGLEQFYVQLSCNHLHPGKIIQSFNCSKCKNKPVCRVFQAGETSGNRHIDEYLSAVNLECHSKLNKDAFQAVLQCKGYME